MTASHRGVTLRVKGFDRFCQKLSSKMSTQPKTTIFWFWNYFYNFCDKYAHNARNLYARKVTVPSDFPDSSWQQFGLNRSNVCIEAVIAL
ncbi:hypothetical protein HW132_33810 [Brasilonema sp. CT11]|nr:hypothetical protein [Brasilonema sp. CT11]